MGAVSSLHFPDFFFIKDMAMDIIKQKRCGYNKTKKI